MNQKDKSEVIRLIKNECANYVNGDCALSLEGYPCVQLNSMLTLSDLGIFLCKYCRDAVMPLNKDLHAKLVGGVRTKMCAECGKEFVPSGNRSKYCDKCAARKKRKQNAEWIRSERSKM